MNSTLGTLGMALFVGALALGCGGEGSGAAPASSGAPAVSGKPATTAAATTTAAAKPAETAAPAPAMTEFDLSTADAKWKGWVAMGPADAKVMADGVNGARIAAKGPSILDQKEGGDQGFDLAFAWGKDDLKELKKNLQNGADHPIGDMKVKITWTKEEPDLLEWTTEVGKMKTYNFVQHIKVEKTDITCKNNYMIGSGNEAEHKRVMDACKTLAKKGK
ncbi:MAG: hypothetical protein U0441_03275 [Polyangiaceae bacterium]